MQRLLLLIDCKKKTKTHERCAHRTMIECIKSIIWICSWNIRVVHDYRFNTDTPSSAQCKFKYNYRIQTLAIICTRCLTDRPVFFISYSFSLFSAQFLLSVCPFNFDMWNVIDAFDSSIIHRSKFSVLFFLPLFIVYFRNKTLGFYYYCLIFLIFLFDVSIFIFVMYLADHPIPALWMKVVACFFFLF